MLSFTSPDFFKKPNFCYEVIVKQKKKKALLYYHWRANANTRTHTYTNTHNTFTPLPTNPLSTGIALNESSSTLSEHEAFVDAKFVREEWADGGGSRGSGVGGGSQDEGLVVGEGQEVLDEHWCEGGGGMVGLSNLVCVMAGAY